MKESRPKLSCVVPLSPRLPLIRYWPSAGTSRSATAPPEPIDWLRVVSDSLVPSLVVGSLATEGPPPTGVTSKRRGAERWRGSLLSSPAVADSSTNTFTVPSGSVATPPRGSVTWPYSAL